MTRKVSELKSGGDNSYDVPPALKSGGDASPTDRRPWTHDCHVPGRVVRVHRMHCPLLCVCVLHVQLAYDSTESVQHIVVTGPSTIRQSRRQHLPVLSDGGPLQERVGRVVSLLQSAT